MSDATKSIEFSNILNMFRLPNLSKAPQIAWAYSTPVCKNLERFGDQALPGILTILLQRLLEIPVRANQTPEDRQTILTCQAFAASTIFASANLYSLKSTWKQLDFYHRSANIEFTDLLQMGMEILSEPYKEHPLHLFHGFDLQQCSKANWNLSTTDFRLGRHPLQLYLKKKFMLLLIDRIRQCDGANDFKRTNNGLLKRTSEIKMREALNQRGNSQTSMLILHKTLVLAGSKDFYTPQPQAGDYQRLHESYQKALIAKKLPTCSFQETQERLSELGSAIRSYGKSNMRSLNVEMGEHGSELLDRFSNHNYSDPLQNCLKLELQEQAQKLKQQVNQQLENLPPIQMEAFWLSAAGHNDSQIAKILSIGASSTVKRRRDKTIRQFLKIPIDKNFPVIADIYMEVAQEYFEVKTK
jgi:hypothetical protein